MTLLVDTLSLLIMLFTFSNLLPWTQTTQLRAIETMIDRYICELHIEHELQRHKDQSIRRRTLRARGENMH